MDAAGKISFRSVFYIYRYAFPAYAFDKNRNYQKTKRNVLIMKKNLQALLPCAIALLLVSCNDSTYETHQTYFYPQAPNGMVFYADQTQDTIHVISLDSWTASISATGDWLSVNPTSGTVVNMQNSDTRLDVTTKVNDTGKVRIGYILVNGYDQVGMPVVQNYWHNITQPSAVNTSSTVITDPTERKVAFPMSLKATSADTSVVFTVYADAQLASEETWIKPETTSFTPGKHKVKVSVGNNATGEARTGKLILTSSGISTPILFNQEAK